MFLEYGNELVVRIMAIITNGNLLRARPKAEQVHRQLADIFHTERPGPTRPDRNAL